VGVTGVWPVTSANHAQNQFMNSTICGFVFGAGLQKLLVHAIDALESMATTVKINIIFFTVILLLVLF